MPAALEATPQATPEHILQLGLGFWASKTLLSAVELGVFTQLAAEPLDADELTKRLGLHGRGARDFLDALVALGVLERSAGLYANTPASGAFLDRGKPSYLGGLLEMANARLYGFWGSLTEALQTGQPQNEVRTGGDFFEALYADPERLRQFLRAMSGLSAGAAHAVAAQFPFDRYQTVADIGCAEGGFLAALAQRHPHLELIGFDLPPTEGPFAEHLGERAVFQAGDFFADPLPNADVLVLGHILHDWNLDEKLTLLRKAYEAVPDQGAVIVYEAIIDDDRRENAFGLLMSLNMLIETPGGFDYTGADCQAWMRDVGFADTYVEHLVGPDSMVVGIK
jgi:trans-aconitate methyltransferase